MENIQVTQPQPSPISQNSSAPKEETLLSPALSFFALFSLLAGYLFCRAFPAMAHSSGSLLLLLILYLITAILLKWNKSFALKPLSIAVGISGLVAAFALFATENDTVQFFSSFYAYAAYGYFVSASTGNLLTTGTGDLIAADFFRALFLLPFSSFGKLFSVLAAQKGKRGFKWILMVFCGLLMAVIPTLIIGLLLSYDQNFTDLLSRIFDWNFSDIFSHLGSLILGIPVAMWFFGLFYSSVSGRCKNNLPAASFHSAAVKARVMPKLLLVSAVLPILFLYLVFFISQWDYYFSAFSGSLPEGEYYAGYAREGFFQLCAVSAINFVILACLSLFMKRKRQDRSPALLKILALLFSVSSLILMATAMSKLVLYIQSYGLTPKRIYAAWFMLLLGVLFLLVCIKQFVPKFKLLFTSGIVTLLFFFTLAFCGSGNLIARYNINAYQTGKLDELDVEMLADDLGDEAVPALIDLAHSLDEELGTDIQTTIRENDIWQAVKKQTGRSDETYDLYCNTAWELQYLSEKNAERSLFSRTIPSIRAQIALTRADLVPEPKDIDRD